MPSRPSYFLTSLATCGSAAHALSQSTPQTGRSSLMAELDTGSTGASVSTYTASVPVTCEAASTTVAERAIAWFHPPKTGTSFGTVLVHYANASLPTDARMSVCSLAPTTPVGINVSVLAPYAAHRCVGVTDYFSTRYPYDTYFRGVFWGAAACSAVEPAAAASRSFLGEWEICDGSISGKNPFCTGASNFPCDFGSHSYVCQADYERYRGSFFGLWRKPQMLSASNFIRDLEKNAITVKGASLTTSGQYVPTDPAVREAILQFANASRAHVTRLLAGAAPAGDPSSTSVFPDVLHDAVSSGTLADNAPMDATPVLPLAMERLSDGFAFVGMTDEFALSACVFHLTFGGGA
ncbi:hypothetical protein OAO87_01965 [bacterium]|nr:hypothetical protein [bacterium]